MIGPLKQSIRRSVGRSQAGIEPRPATCHWTAGTTQPCVYKLEYKLEYFNQNYGVFLYGPVLSDRNFRKQAGWSREMALSRAAVASERGRMVILTAASGQRSGSECGELSPSKKVRHNFPKLLWYFPSRSGAAGWLYLATERHERAHIMLILWVVYLLRVRRAPRPSFLVLGAEHRVLLPRSFRRRPRQWPCAFV